MILECDYINNNILNIDCNYNGYYDGNHDGYNGNDNKSNNDMRDIDDKYNKWQ